MKNIKNILKNKKGASIMEFFILTIVVLLIGAIVFILGGNMKKGVDKVDKNAQAVGNTLNDNTTAGYNSFN